jgi:hypothetical protein
MGSDNVFGDDGGATGRARSNGMVAAGLSVDLAVPVNAG